MYYSEDSKMSESMIPWSIQPTVKHGAKETKRSTNTHDRCQAALLKTRTPIRHGSGNVVLRQARHILQAFANTFVMQPCLVDSTHSLVSPLLYWCLS